MPHVVWPSDAGTGGSGADADFFYARRVGGVCTAPELVNTWGTTDADDFELDCALVRHQNGDLRVIFGSQVDAAGAGGDPDLFTARRSGTGWSEPELLLGDFKTDAARDGSFRAGLHGNTLHLTWYRALLGVRAGYMYAAVNLTAPLPTNPAILLASNSLSLPTNGLLFVGGSTLVLRPDGLLFFGYANNVDLGGTIGNDNDVPHTWVRVFDPLLFADSFEAPAAPPP